MSLLVHSYLRRERRKWALTQKDLVFLLGKSCPAHMSRLEHGKRPPSAHILIACEMLFGVPAQSIFPKIYADIEECVLAHAATLFETLENDPGSEAIKKKELLSALLKRAITRLNSNEGV